MAKEKRSLKLQKKYLWSFFLVVICIDLLITVGLFALYGSIQVQKATEYTVAQLEQACTSTDILYNSMRAVVNQVIADSETASFLLSSKMDRLQEAGVGIKLRAWRTANPYMRYITLYNDTNKRFVSSAYAGYDSDLEVEEFYRRLGDEPYACYLRQIGADYNVQKTKKAKAYTFVFPVTLNPNGSRDLVIIDVNDSYFNQALSPIRTPGEEQQIILQDDRGGLIAIMKAAAEDDSFSVLLAQDGTSRELEFLDSGREARSGSFSHREGAKRFVAYACANVAGWTIYSILPYKTVLTGLGSLAALTLSLMLITLAFGYFLSRQLSSSLYAPIKVLYESYVSGESRTREGNELELLGDAFSEMYSKADRLEQGLISSYHASKNIYLRYLLSGEEDKVRASQLTYKRLEIDLNSPYYGLILMECTPQDPGDPTERPEKDPNLFICYYALENITRELLECAGRMEFLQVEETRFAVLLYLQTEAVPEEALQGLRTVAATMSQEFSIDTTICVGNVTSSWTDINFAYEQVCIAFHSRSASLYGKVFFPREVSQPMSSGLYYNKLHEELAEYVRAGDSRAMADAYDRALAAMENISFKTAKSYSYHVLMSVLDNFASFFERDDSAFSRMIERLNGVESCQNVRSLKSVVLGFLEDLIRRLENNRKNSNRSAAERVREYIDKNYQDPSLSLRMLADMVNLSPAYLGKVFTAVTTYTFNDYLNTIRTSRAAELLLSTGLPVSKISEEVGILNTNYFYSVFKKRYGVTPSAYRRERPEPPADPGKGPSPAEKEAAPAQG